MNRLFKEVWIQHEKFDQINVQLAFLNYLSCGLCIVERDENLTIKYANQTFYSLLGQSLNQEALLSFSNIILEKEFVEIIKEVQYQIKQQRTHIHFKIKVHHSPKAKWLLFECYNQPLMMEQMVWTITDVTYQMDIQKQFNNYKNEMKLVMEKTGKFILRYEFKSQTLYIPEALSLKFGLPITCSLNIFDYLSRIVNQEDQSKLIEFYHRMLEGEPFGEVNIKLKDLQGGCNWYSINYNLTYDHLGNKCLSMMNIEDITLSQEKELAYMKWKNYKASKQSKTYLSLECDLTSDTIEEKIGELSSICLTSFSKTMAYFKNHLIIDQDKQQFEDFFNIETLTLALQQQNNDLTLEFKQIAINGEEFYAKADVHLIIDPFTNHLKASILIKNIHHQKELLRTLKQRSIEDSLTGLYNRKAMIEEVNQFLTLNPKRMHTLVMIDINHFKKINDTLGHSFGDQVLIDIATILKQGLRNEDLCCRIGGDEFVMLLKNIKDHEDLLTIIERIQLSLSLNYTPNIKVSGSIGYACFPNEGMDFKELYEKADQSMYRMKKIIHEA